MTSSLAARVCAYLLGDQMAAEDMDEYSDVPTPAWLARAAADEELSKYALEAAIRSAEGARASLASVQAKATSFLGILMLVIPLSLAATGLAIPKTLDWLLIAALTAALVADVLLVSAAIVASMASGLVIGGGLNVERLDPENGATLPAMRAAEADAWHYSATLARESGARRSYDLFQSRRLALLGLILIGTSALMLVASSAPAA